MPLYIIWGQDLTLFKVLIDGSDIGKCPLEICLLYPHELSLGAYGPPVATLAKLSVGNTVVLCPIHVSKEYNGAPGIECEVGRSGLA